MEWSEENCLESTKTLQRGILLFASNSTHTGRKIACGVGVTVGGGERKSWCYTTRCVCSKTPPLSCTHSVRVCVSFAVMRRAVDTRTRHPKMKKFYEAFRRDVMCEHDGVFTRIESLCEYLFFTPLLFVHPSRSVTSGDERERMKRSYFLMMCSSDASSLGCFFPRDK